MNEKWLLHYFTAVGGRCVHGTCRRESKMIAIPLTLKSFVKVTGREACHREADNASCRRPARNNADVKRAVITQMYAEIKCRRGGVITAKKRVLKAACGGLSL